MNSEFIKPQNLGSFLIKLGQSNFDLRSPGSYLVCTCSYLITTVQKLSKTISVVEKPLICAKKKETKVIKKNHNVCGHGKTAQKPYFLRIYKRNHNISSAFGSFESFVVVSKSSRVH